MKLYFSCIPKVYDDIIVEIVYDKEEDFLAYEFNSRDRLSALCSVDDIYKKIKLDFFIQRDLFGLPHFVIGLYGQEFNGNFLSLNQFILSDALEALELLEKLIAKRTLLIKHNLETKKKLRHTWAWPEPVPISELDFEVYILSDYEVRTLIGIRDFYLSIANYGDSYKKFFDENPIVL